MKRFDVITLVSIAMNFIIGFIFGLFACMLPLVLYAIADYVAENGMTSDVLVAGIIWGFGMIALFEAYRWVKNNWIEVHDIIIASLSEKLTAHNQCRRELEK